MRNAPKNHPSNHQAGRPAESGNVLFYILIAVALIAALSFAVANSTRGNIQQLTQDRARLYATEIIEYANVMGNAISQIRLRGTEVSELCFDHDSWPNNNYDHAGCTDDFNKIFHPSGAGLSWTEAPTRAMDAAGTPDNLWHIYGNNAIEQVGTTCTADTCADLILMVDELNIEVCRQINTLLGVTNPGGDPPTDTNYFTDEYAGSLTFDANIGDEDAALAGQTSGCFHGTTPNKHAFYKVLVSR